MKRFEDLLSGGDLRSIGESNELLPLIKTQKDFDDLFALLFHEDRVIVMRAADCIEKVTRNNSPFLLSHKDHIVTLSHSAADKELMWHLAQLLPRVPWNKDEVNAIWERLRTWVLQKEGSRIVRVNALQTMFELSHKNKNLRDDFLNIMDCIVKENIPSINARIRKLQKECL